MLVSRFSTMPEESHFISIYYTKLLLVIHIVLCVQSAISSAQLLPLETKPIFPYYYIGCYRERTDLLKETIYAKLPQTCVEICEHQALAYAVLSGERCFCANDLVEDERQDEILCSTRCMADKTQYCGGIGLHSYYSTRLAKEPAPKHLKIGRITENTLEVMWEAPQATHKIFVTANGTETMPQQITHFLIKSKPVHSYSSLPFFPQPEFIIQAIDNSFEITDLMPATGYNISVAAMCGPTVCGNVSISATTEVGVPSPPPAEPRILQQTDNTMTVQLPLVKNDNGPVTKLLVVVERVDETLSQPFDTQLLGDWRKAQDDGLPYYIAAELDYNNTSQKFVVGDGKRYGRYENIPLDLKDTHMHINLGIESSLNGITKRVFRRGSHDQHTTGLDNFTYATFESGSESIIALTVTCVVFGIFLVLSIITYFFLRYKTCKIRSGAARNAHEMTLQEPIMERENNGYVVEDELPTAENFKQQLDTILNSLDGCKRLPRSMLRMNVNDVIADGRYGEVITGKLISTVLPDASTDCQLHMLALDDLTGNDQAHFLQELRKLTRVQGHDHLIDFYGVSATSDWFYMVFEYQGVSLKRRLVESRRAPNSAPVQRLTALSEELVLEWIYEIASAMGYLRNCKVVHKNLCSYNVFVTAEAKLKVTLFGPIPYSNQQKKVDISRWLAPESLRYQHFSSKSDVWAFACVAWECCTLGATLYANITNTQQLLDAIKSGSRPAQPVFMYQDLYQLLINCWQLEPSERIDFEDIALAVRQLMTSPRHALCFDRTPELPGHSVLDTLPFYLPMLETLQ